MSDQIDRQAAINVMCKLMHHWFWGDLKDETREIKRQLEKLPSAQPEIIRCKDCKYRIVNEHYGEKGYMDLKAMCELDTDDIFELGRCAEDDDWFCADAERREDDKSRVRQSP